MLGGRQRRILSGAAASLLAALLMPAARAQENSPAARVRVGHWLEVRGELRDDGLFHADEAELKAPEREELLIGTVTSSDRGRGRFELLGQPVTLSGDTELEGVTARSLDGQRVEVEGDYGGPQEFEAEEVEAQSEGSDRIGGRVEKVRSTPDGVVVRIMRYDILLPQTIEHEGSLDDIPMAPAPERDVAVREIGGFDEDDLFGRGTRLGETVNLSGQVRIESTTEENFDLDRDDPEDRRDQEGSARLRLQWYPSRVLHAVGELRASERYRDDEEDGSSSLDQLALGETYLYFVHPRSSFDLQIGRQDFDDEREWLYDRNLDGLRLIHSFFPWRLELSATTTLDGSARDEDATNWIGYLSRERADRHLALYVVHRDIDGEIRERPTHLGFRILGDRGWLDLAWLAGEAGGRDLGGWGLDLGRTFEPKALDPVYITVAYAVGSGGKEGEEEGTDRTFRQTGFHDNNGKFGGVTSFRYYGELAEPELANLHVATLGLGARLSRRVSLDLVGHYYRQDEPAEVFSSEIDEDPDGLHRELGWAVDLVYGDRRWRIFDLEVVGAYFVPGDAFAEEDDALMGKIQMRFRF